MICSNCENDVDILHRVGGYFACDDCTTQAALPPHLRGDQ